jgi:putative flippase GtrA
MLELLRFLAVGVANTIVGLGTIYALKWFAGLGDIPANAVGYVVGLMLSFVLNRNWTFSDHGAWVPALMRFLVVFVVAYTANLGMMLQLRDRWHVDSYLAHAIAVVPYTMLFFLGSRLFVFRAGARMVASSRAEPRT